MLASDRLVLLILIGWGLTNIVAGSKILAPIRSWLHKYIPFIGQMTSCYMCCGFWVGAFLSLIVFGPRNQLHLFQSMLWDDGTRLAFTAILDGFIVSGMVWIINVVLVKLGSEKL